MSLIDNHHSQISTIDKQDTKIAIDPAVVNNAYSYEGYRTLVDELFEGGSATDGNNSESMLHYTRLNQARMKRLDKKTVIADETSSFLMTIDQDLLWLVLTEGWCGDAAQILPVLNKMAGVNPKIDLKVILRDENLDVMDQFLTNGGRSIPMILVLDAKTLTVLAKWGPRPSVVQAMVLSAKDSSSLTEDPEEAKRIADSAKLEAQRWYTADKSASIQHEFLEQLRNIVP